MWWNNLWISNDGARPLREHYLAHLIGVEPLLVLVGLVLAGFDAEMLCSATGVDSLQFQHAVFLDLLAMELDNLDLAYAAPMAFPTSLLESLVEPDPFGLGYGILEPGIMGFKNLEYENPDFFPLTPSSEARIENVLQGVTIGSTVNSAAGNIVGRGSPGVAATVNSNVGGVTSANATVAISPAINSTVNGTVGTGNATGGISVTVNVTIGGGPAGPSLNATGAIDAGINATTVNATTGGAVNTTISVPAGTSVNFNVGTLNVTGGVGGGPVTATAAVPVGASVNASGNVGVKVSTTNGGIVGKVGGVTDGVGISINHRGAGASKLMRVETVDKEKLEENIADSVVHFSKPKSNATSNIVLENKFSQHGNTVGVIGDAISSTAGGLDDAGNAVGATVGLVGNTVGAIGGTVSSIIGGLGGTGGNAARASGSKGNRRHVKSSNKNSKRMSAKGYGLGVADKVTGGIVAAFPHIGG
ncbi:OLC1v1015833C1 [Oldenlandia corymbosa var. corymbosa]|uniref:OLC1v1015833C1 n=1 Tax=Oldenlandia corymbosa var. corymbosa TaxID=529605 RepID=A0AAV1E4D5_OLDCO|nr:OLC1v1015833C1 [Oldenlandia corymbosa var. corymbosa]